MNLPLALRLGAAEVRAHPARAAVVVLALTLALALPGFVLVGGARLERQLYARALATPLVVGPRGSPYETVFSIVYFQGDPPRSALSGELAASMSERGMVVPLVLGQRAAGRPLVGTTLDYLDLRGLRLAEGRTMALPGEVLVGAQVAARAGLRPGDRLVSEWVGLPDLASASVELEVVGILEWTGSPDDVVLFTDILTIRAIQGHLHAHRPTTGEGGADEPAESAAALFLTEDLRPETVHRFHLHGDALALPVSGFIVRPHDARSRDQLLGDLVEDPSAQAVEPERIIQEVLDVILRVRAAMLIALGVLLAGALLLVGTILALAAQRRAAEIALLRRLGAGRATLMAVVGAEGVGLVSLAAVLAIAMVAGAVLLLGL